MLDKKSISILFICFISFFTACKGSPAIEQVPGIHQPLGVQGAEVSLQVARVRHSVQTYYLMDYPPDSQVFFEVVFSITGISDDPLVTQSWGEENIILVNQELKYQPSFSRRIIDQEEVEYIADEEINFIYAYYYEVPEDSDYIAFSLQLPEDQSIPLGSIVQVPKSILLAGEGDLGSTIGGGSDNTASATHATVSGGQSNTASAAHASIGGGYQNNAGYFFATVGGGYANNAEGRDSVIGGGSRNSALGDRSTVGGGIQNLAEAADSTISGGAFNMVSDNYAVVSGGTQNQASGYASTICGGAGNTASADQASVIGGLSNQAINKYAVVGGGYGSIASGEYSAVPGGYLNEASGNYSLAAGQQAKISPEHPGVFLFADSNQFPFISQSPNEFAVRSTGGVRFVSEIDSDGNPIAGVVLQPGSGAWSMLSDQSKKADLNLIDSVDLLNRLSQIPITSWRYQGQDSSVRHIGPMAGDFYQAFGFGEDSNYISTVDADGVALAAVQGSYLIIQEQTAQINILEERVSHLENTIAVTRITLGLSAGVLLFVSYLMLHYSRRIATFVTLQKTQD
jgi:hypothetical protein